jgi:hypothetical protein
MGRNDAEGFSKLSIVSADRRILRFFDTQPPILLISLKSAGFIEFRC